MLWRSPTTNHICRWANEWCPRNHRMICKINFKNRIFWSLESVSEIQNSVPLPIAILLKLIKVFFPKHPLVYITFYYSCGDADLYCRLLSRLFDVPPLETVNALLCDMEYLPEFLHNIWPRVVQGVFVSVNPPKQCPASGQYFRDALLIIAREQAHPYLLYTRADLRSKVFESKGKLVVNRTLISKMVQEAFKSCVLFGLKNASR